MSQSTEPPSRDPENPGEPLAVIKFLGKNSRGQAIIDLVRKDWFDNRENKENTCKFPPEEEYHLLDGYLRKCQQPKKSWKSYPFIFITGAENVEQGRRRLKRAQVTRNCETTDGESAPVVRQPQTLSKTQVQDVLNTNIPMHREKRTPNTSKSTRSTVNRLRRVVVSNSDSESESSDLSPQKAQADKISRDLDNSSGRTKIMSGSKSSKTGSNPKLSRTAKNLMILSNDLESDDLETDDLFPMNPSPTRSSPKKSNNPEKHSENPLDLTPSPPTINQRIDKRKRTSSFDGWRFPGGNDDWMDDIISPPKTPKSSRSEPPIFKKKKTLTSPGSSASCVGVHLNNHPMVDAAFQKYFDEKLDKKLESLRQRLAYDFRKSINELKSTIVGTNLPPAAGPSLIEVQRRLSVPLPLETPEQFINYEAVLEIDENEMQSLHLFFKVLISNQKNEKTCVSTVMSAMVKKVVELDYSAYGREAKGQKKKDFSATRVCKVLIDVIGEFFGAETNKKKILSEVSTWLSRAGDRDGGRKERQSGARRRSRSA